MKMQWTLSSEESTRYSDTSKLSMICSMVGERNVSYITSSGGFIYYYVCNYSLGSWRICGSIFLASSRTPSSCGRLVRASSLWEVLRWLTLGFVSSSLDIPLSLSEPSWGGATLAEPQAQARLKNDLSPSPGSRASQERLFASDPSLWIWALLLHLFCQLLLMMAFSCSSLEENMWTNILATSWGRMRIILIPR